MRRGILGGRCGEAAQLRASDSLDGLRPAKARDLRGELGTLRNLIASRTTYFPVNPEAPRIMTSKILGLFSAIFFCRDFSGMKKVDSSRSRWVLEMREEADMCSVKDSILHCQSALETPPKGTQAGS